MDISKRSEVRDLFESIRPDVIFHLASVVDLRSYPDQTVFDVNERGTKWLVDAAKRSATCSYFVYCASIDVVGGEFGVKDANESTPYPRRPSNAYKATKGAAERYVLKANGASLRTCSLRPGHLFGPGDVLFEHITAFPIAIGDVKTCRMSFTYIEHAARAHVDCLARLRRKNDNDDVAGKPFFINDFDVNFFDAYYTFASKPMPSVFIPTWIFWIVLLTIQLLSHVLHAVGGFRLPLHPVTGLNTASIESGVVLTADASRARRVLGYMDPRHYVDKDTAMRHTQAWVTKTTGVLSASTAVEAETPPLLPKA